jgi:CheY-like chemotaxis protein
MKCPRCHAEITAPPEPGGSLVCPGCGARLKSKSASGSSAPAASAAGTAPSAPRPGNPSATLPPGTPLKKVPRAAEETHPAGRGAPPPVAVAEAPPGPTVDYSDTLDTLLQEIRALRVGQEEILALLKGRPGSGGGSWVEGEAPFESNGADAPLQVPTVRSGRRKSVLLIDDDPETRQAAQTAFELADVPITAVEDGNTALATIASDKPDVICLELDMQGPLAGKDVVNMIKATMEWVDIPIVLYTRVPIENQKEARLIHGADEFVLKEAHGPDALVGRVIALFRKS